ncbi:MULTISPECIES: hypothetical protein [Clostridium]|jgi:hypothetical protein|nr:hypothetical protein [Clostridium tyrobutyricum]
MKIKENPIVVLKDGRKGKVIGTLQNGEYMLESGNGGQITFFIKDDIVR